MTSFLIYSTEPGTQVAVACDIIVSAEFEKTWEASEFPVESGTPVSDNVVRKNDRLTIKVTQSETPLQNLVTRTSKTLKRAKSSFKPKGLWAATEAIGSLFTGEEGPLKVVTYDAAVDKDFVNDFETELVTAANIGAPCEVLVKGKTRSDLVIVSISRTEISGGAEFTIGFQQRRSVSTALTTGLPLPISLKPPVNKGVTKTKELSAEEKGEKSTTLAAKGLDWAAGK